MYVDASAIIAILTDESEAKDLADVLDLAPEPITSAIGIFEAVLGFCRKRRTTVAQGQRAVLDFLDSAGIRTVAITERELIAALSAFERYGKGRGHPAQLNMGDCFAYAAADVAHVPLLFKGDDFSKTDIGIAWASPPPPAATR